MEHGDRQSKRIVEFWDSDNGPMTHGQYMNFYYKLKEIINTSGYVISDEKQFKNEIATLISSIKRKMTDKPSKDFLEYAYSDEDAKEDEETIREQILKECFKMEDFLEFPDTREIMEQEFRWKFEKGWNQS